MAKPKTDAAAPITKPGVTADDFARHYRAIRAKKAEVDDKVAEYRVLRKRAKDAGIGLKPLAMLESLAKMDEAEATLVLKQLGLYSKAAGMPWAVQQDLFGYDDAPGPSAESLHDEAMFQAADDGRKCGIEGNSATLNPHKPGEEAYVHWLSGWEVGKAQHDKVSSLRGAAVSKPRGRPRKGGNPEDRPAP